MTRSASRPDLDLALAAADVVGNYMSHNPAPFAALPEMYEKFHHKLIEILDKGPRPDKSRPTTKDDLDLVVAAANVVGRFVTINPVPFAMLPEMIERTHATLVAIVDKGPRANFDITSTKPSVEKSPSSSQIYVQALLASPSPVVKMAASGNAGKGVNEFREDYVISEPTETPAVPVNLSVWRDRLVCLECGKPFAALKRHLKFSHTLDEKQYRLRYGLSPTYPMSCENYRDSRRELVKDSNFKALTKAELAAKKRGEKPRAKTTKTRRGAGR